MALRVAECALTVATIFVSMSCAAAQEYRDVEDMEAFRKELTLATSSKTSIRARFVQTKYMSVFSREIRSEGTFWWQADDKICLDYQTPAKYSMTIAGDRIRTVNAGKSTVVSLKGNPVMSRMRTLTSACMTGNLAALSSGFSLKCQESADDYRITVTPLDSDVSGYITEMEIYLSRKDLSVDRLVIHESGTDYTGYVFSDKKFNETAPSSVFDMR